MLAYSIIKTGGRRPIPLVVFEDSRYEIVSAFLLAETRNFGSEIEAGLTSLMNEETDEYRFSGNVYTLYSDRKESEIIDDVSENDLHITVPTAELQRLVSEYRIAYRRWHG